MASCESSRQGTHRGQTGLLGFTSARARALTDLQAEHRAVLRLDFRQRRLQPSSLVHRKGQTCLCRADTNYRKRFKSGHLRGIARTSLSVSAWRSISVSRSPSARSRSRSSDCRSRRRNSASYKQHIDAHVNNAHTRARVQHFACGTTDAEEELDSLLTCSAPTEPSLFINVPMVFW